MSPSTQLVDLALGFSKDGKVNDEALKVHGVMAGVLAVLLVLSIRSKPKAVAAPGKAK